MCLYIIFQALQVSVFKDDQAGRESGVHLVGPDPMVYGVHRDLLGHQECANIAT